MAFLGAGVQHNEGTFTFCEMNCRQQDKKEKNAFSFKKQNTFDLKK